MLLDLAEGCTTGNGRKSLKLRLVGAWGQAANQVWSQERIDSKLDIGLVLREFARRTEGRRWPRRAQGDLSQEEAVVFLGTERGPVCSQHTDGGVPWIGQVVCVCHMWLCPQLHKAVHTAC